MYAYVCNFRVHPPGGACYRKDMVGRCFAVLVALGLVSAPAAIAVADEWPGAVVPDGAAFERGWGRDLSPAEAAEAATEMLRGAGEGPRDAQVKATAHLMRGLARYRLGQYRSAVRDLGRAENGPVHNRDVAGFFRAESLFHAGEYAAARERFERFERRYPDSTWRHRAEVRAADCRVAMGEPQAGVKALTGILRSYPEYPHRAAIRYALARASRLAGDLDGAARWLERIVWELPEDPMVHTARRELAGLEAQGVVPEPLSVADAHARGRDLRKRKYWPAALATLQPLLTDSRTDKVDRWRARYEIARTLFQQERYAEAATSFATLVGDARSARSTRLARHWQAYSLERLGRLDQAATTLLQAKGSVETPSAEALYKVGWLYFDGARYEKALGYFQRAAKKGRAWRRKTHWLRAWLAYRLGDYPVAAKAFKALQASSRKRADRYGYWLARTLVKQGELDAAADTYRGIIEQAPLSYYAYQARARLAEIGRPLLEEPPAEEAPEVAEAEQAPPEAGIACEPGAERPGCRLVAAVDATAEAVDESPEAVAERPGATEGEEAPVFIVQKPEAPDAVELLRELSRRWGGAMPDLARAHELAVIGESRWALLALRRVSNELRAFYRAGRKTRNNWRWVDTPYVDYRKLDRPRGEWGRTIREKGPQSSRKRVRFLGKRRDSAFWPLLRDAFAAVGDFHYFRRHSRAEDKVSGRPEGPQNNAWRRRYARAFRPLVEQHARHYGLDPHFIWALMTVESTYNPWAISRASARGLMQVMPHTGTLVADRMHWRNFGPALLFEPEVATEMAAWYFHQLLRKFNGQLPLAIAGYNAGPHRVAYWLTRKGHLDMDEFIEEIPYTEAREYTKKVLRYLALYRRTYQGDDALTVGQVIDPDFRDNINF